MKTEVKNDSQKDAAVTLQPLNVCGMKKKIIEEWVKEENVQCLKCLVLMEHN